MTRFSEKFMDVFTVLAAIGPKTCLVVLIALIAVVVACFEDEPDPIDHSINKSQQVVRLLDVVDSAHNGFCVHYATAYPVTEERFEEIISRPSLDSAFQCLQHDAPLHFGGSLLETDIYDFAAFAREYDVTTAVHIDCIFVTGPGKIAMYSQPNPNLPDGETWIDPRTEQGLQWINHHDIYFCMENEQRVYRYWKCPGIREISLTDERFTHYTTAEKVH